MGGGTGLGPTQWPSKAGDAKARAGLTPARSQTRGPLGRKREVVEQDAAHYNRKI